VQQRSGGEPGEGRRAQEGNAGRAGNMALNLWAACGWPERGPRQGVGAGCRRRCKVQRQRVQSHQPVCPGNRRLDGVDGVDGCHVQLEGVPRRLKVM
jgi:hypothetical protein